MEKRPVGLTILAIFNLYQAASALLVMLIAFCFSIMAGNGRPFRSIIPYLLSVPFLACLIISGIGMLKMRYRSGYICGITFGVCSLLLVLISNFLNGWSGFYQNIITVFYPLTLVLLLKFRYRNFFITADGITDKNSSLFLHNKPPFTVEKSGVISESLSGITKVKLQFDQIGLRIEDEINHIEFLDWDSVLEVFAFKSDVFAYDLICIGFRIDHEGDYFEVNEEAEGYADLIRYLPEIFPDIKSDWFTEVAFPAFKANVTTLWGCPEIKKLWEPEKQNYEIMDHFDPTEEKFRFHLPGKIGGILGILPILLIAIFWVTGKLEFIFFVPTAFVLIGSLSIGLPLVLANIVDANLSKLNKILISLGVIVFYILPLILMVLWFIGLVGVSFTS